jgi:hypothetical protein
MFQLLPLVRTELVGRVQSRTTTVKATTDAEMAKIRSRR